MRRLMLILEQPATFFYSAWIAETVNFAGISKGHNACLSWLNFFA